MSIKKSKKRNLQNGSEINIITNYKNRITKAAHTLQWENVKD